MTGAFAKYSGPNEALFEELKKITEAMTAPGKGIFAADESPGSLQDRFDAIGLENTEINRRDYREMLFSADKSQLTKCISGVILHHETAYQKTSEGVEFLELLRQQNLIPGIKVDRGLVQIFGTDEENSSQGLDDLQERCIAYKKNGCHFAKWRCSFNITDKLPSRLALIENSNVLARYASICQSARMVPIMEPEIVTSGSHSVEKCRRVHEELLSILFRSLNEHHVYLEGVILKMSMILPGAENESPCTSQIIAENTVTALQRTVPIALPAIIFLSGGQSDEEAVLNLNSINTCHSKKPWVLSFCYGRALQNSALEVWSGQQENKSAAQEMFLARAKLCSQASLGTLEMNEESGDPTGYKEN